MERYWRNINVVFYGKETSFKKVTVLYTKTL